MGHLIRDDIYDYDFIAKEIELIQSNLSRQEAPAAYNDSIISNKMEVKQHSKKSIQSIKGRREQINIEINSADTSMLMQLKGIGKVYSKRIVKYRNILGGFYKKEQLLEVYGIDRERLANFENNISVDTSFIKKINLNNTEFKEMLKHPYLSYDVVKSIFNYKSKEGSFINVKDLIVKQVIDSLLYLKVEPYLTVN